MRLIDADALIKTLKSHTVEDTGFDDCYKAGLTDSIRIAVDLVEKAPTSDPIQHGHWTEVIDFDGLKWGVWYCSNCLSTPAQDYSEHPFLSVHCPHCGAKMDGEPNE